MYLEEGLGGGGYEGQPCKGCQTLIMPGQPVTRVILKHDPNALSGDYHTDCGKPIAALARAMNMLSRPFT
jgi:hypothetical protein